ncbi:acyl-CoA-binding protein [uncultured Polaribacter sp.]|uniref:acyl-CoA-binding protein n=1 Tax=uncultured Polaribacter sp. TaxID=174711 RepID=UPI002611EAF3|nr:acyl-CoA-binding protein [uncultured Polaribacter sp.]
MSSDLEIAFEEAFRKISTLKEAVAPDVMLKFYAYNKQANFGSNFSFDAEPNVRNAFKANAWMQLKGMSSEEAKKEYINLANAILNNKK